MFKRPQANDEPVPLLTCEDRIHAIRVRHEYGQVLCVPQLEMLPLDHAPACEHGMKKQKG